MFVDISGELDSYGAAEIYRPLCEFAAAAGDIVVDASWVTFIDSAGLRLLEQLADIQRANDGTVSLHNPSKPVTRLLTIVSADPSLKTCTNDWSEQLNLPTFAPCALEDSGTTLP